MSDVLQKALDDLNAELGASFAKAKEQIAQAVENYIDEDMLEQDELAFLYNEDRKQLERILGILGFIRNGIEEIIDYQKDMEARRDEDIINSL